MKGGISWCVNMSKVRQYVAGLIKQDEYVLLVQGQGEADWGLPGGVARPGEPLEMALKRVIREETGLSVRKVGGILYMVRVLDRVEGTDRKVYVFGVEAWDGVLRPGDPHSHTLSAEFMPPHEAIDKLNELPEAVARDPIVAYLGGEIGAGYVWLYHHRNGDDILLTRRPSSSL